MRVAVAEGVAGFVPLALGGLVLVAVVVALLLADTVSTITGEGEGVALLLKLPLPLTVADREPVQVTETDDVALRDGVIVPVMLALALLLIDEV